MTTLVKSHSERIFVSMGNASSSKPLRLANLISGMKGDSHRMVTTLQAVYNPRS
ncbi:hypothetical protein Bca4012_019060 [Brassica carinata]